MENTLRYRTGSIEDIHQLRRVSIASYMPFAHSMTPENAQILNDSIHDAQKLTAVLNKSKCFVCADGDKIVGVIYIVPSGNPWEIFEADWSYIRMLGVDPDYRGRGIARKLTQMCLDFAKQNQEKTIALHTSEMMDVARHIYETLGFKVVKEIEPRFGKRYWLYTLDLS